MLVWEIPASVPTLGERGNLSGPWVIGRIICALEFYISVLIRVKVSKIGAVCIDWRLHCIERGVPESILEPDGRKVLGKTRYPILLEVCMLVMLLNVKIHVLVKVKVLAVSLIPEGLYELLGVRAYPWVLSKYVCVCLFVCPPTNYVGVLYFGCETAA